MSRDQFSFADCSSWLGEKAAYHYQPIFPPDLQGKSWQRMKEQDFEDFGLDQVTQVLRGITLLPNWAVSVFKLCLHIPGDEPNRFENAIVWTEIFLKTELSVFVFKRKRIRVDKTLIMLPWLRMILIEIIRTLHILTDKH